MFARVLPKATMDQFTRTPPITPPTPQPDQPSPRFPDAGNLRQLSPPAARVD